MEPALDHPPRTVQAHATSARTSIWTRLTFASLWVTCFTACVAAAPRASVWFASEPGSIAMLGTFSLLLVLVTIALSIFTLPAAALWTLRFDPSRLRHALLLAGLCMLTVLAYFILWSLDSPSRAVSRVTPLIGAIEQFERDRGVPPARLDDLVPGYLPVLPTTACPSFPSARYSLRTDAPDRRWELQIDCQSNLFGFEWLVYDPEQSYPANWSGASRIGDWVHVND